MGRFDLLPLKRDNIGLINLVEMTESL